jgi:hypothetical protein
MMTTPQGGTSKQIGGAQGKMRKRLPKGFKRYMPSA